DRVDLFERRLDGLSLEDSRELIEKLLRLHGFGELSDDTFDKIYYKVKGHPFSIKLFISLLVSGGYSLDSLLDTASEFEEEMERFLLDKVWEILNESEQEVLKALSVLRISLKGEEYPLIVGTPKLKKSLRQLLDMYIVEYNQEGKVFLHDLLKDYTRNKLDDKLLHKLHLEAAGYFTGKKNPDVVELKEAYFHFHEAGKLQEAVDVIVKISELFFLLGEESESFFHLVNDALTNCKNYRYDDLIKVKIRLLTFVNKYQEAERLINEVKDAGEKKFLMGKINQQKGQFREAVKCYETAMDTDCDLMRMEIFNGKAICFFYLGEWQQAEQNYRQALDQVVKLDAPLMRARILSNFAVLLNRMGKPYQAIEYYEEAEKILRQSNSLSLLARIYFNKANLFNQQMELSKARENLNESTAIMDRIRDHHGLIYNYGLYGDIAFQEEDYDAAMSWLKKALSYCEKYADNNLRTEILFFFGRILTHLKRLDEAEPYFQSALELNSKLDNHLVAANLYTEYAQFLMVRGDYLKAADYLEKVRVFADSTKHQELLIRSLYFLSKISEQGIDGEKKKSWQQDFLRISAEIPTPVMERLNRSFRWFEEQVFTRETKGFFVLTPKDGRRQVDVKEMAKLRSARESFEIFIDFVEQELLINGKIVNFFKKRTLVPLLAELAVNPGQIYDFSKLFESVWHREYDPDADGVTLRVNVSRLRSLLGDKKGNEHFIRSASDIGGYYFNEQTNYCILTATGS
ncbi:MAG: tetratricopeptide repeat protein, partial [Candidatus Wallbacteria bacterium]|nr:tetratricopeptide repeat protein [Candidatus Wallbacteria bacterium]